MTSTSNPNGDPAGRAILKRLLSPWGIAAILLAIFFSGEVYLYLRDRAVEAALGNDPAFAAPAFDLAFSKKIPYDPLALTGRGAQAGYWKWSPTGLVLADEGRKYFDESGEMFVSHSAAGKRNLQRIRTNVATGDGDRRIEFLFKWTEVSPPAATLLVPPPRLTDEYPGVVVMTRAGANWKVKSLRAEDFEATMSHLKQAASGVLK